MMAKQYWEKKKKNNQKTQPPKKPQLSKNSDWSISFASERKHSKRKDSHKNPAGDPKREQLVLPVFWQKSQLQEVFCS